MTAENDSPEVSLASLDAVGLHEEDQEVTAQLSGYNHSSLELGIQLHIE